MLKRKKYVTSHATLYTMTNKKITFTRGLLALSPLLVFVTFYLTGSIIAHDFYKVPVTVAFVVSCFYAIAISKGKSIDERVAAFSKGAGTSGMMMMIWIFILAGAFASSAKAMGAIDATVNLCLHLLPPQMIFAGLFIASCLISLSIGTSVGTIVALVPIAAGMAKETDSSVALLTAIVVGGAYFGDNLSFISDTTIMATRTQGCKMSDKFMANSAIVAPAAIIAFVMYIIMGADINVPHDLPAVNCRLVIPYFAVLFTAIMGLNVMLVLVLGILLTLIIGLVSGCYDFYGWMASMGEGMLGMAELIIITLLAGGLIQVVRDMGGVDFIIERLTSHIKGKRGAELSIGMLVFLTNLCTANNTIAILTVGPLAKDIAERYEVDKRKSASILDTFSCLAQSIIPYGAQLLMASSLATISAFEIIPYLYYPFLMGACALISILIRYPKKFS